MGGKKSSPAPTAPPVPIPDAKASADGAGMLADQQATAASSEQKKPGATLGSTQAVNQTPARQAEVDRAKAAATAPAGGLNSSAVLTG